ncbi:Lipoate-protein ligase A [Thermodesulfovibrio sp. N1]|nr:Lipoate-protein ligase A [Thermodesulfovibrio sp. N1]
MAIDEAVNLFVRKDKVVPTFRFYGWESPSISIGEFQNINDVNIDFCSKKNIPIVRRPTGGKGIFHFDDLTYSFSSKKEGIFKGSLFKSYEIISQILGYAFILSGLNVEIRREKRITNRSALCFARSSFGEICYKEFKIVGSAQKRWIDGFLQQGTIPLKVNRELIKEVFNIDDGNLNRIYGIKELYENFEIYKFIDNVKKSFKSFGFEILEEEILEEELAVAEELLDKYQNPGWLLGKNLHQFAGNRQSMQ